MKNKKEGETDQHSNEVEIVLELTEFLLRVGFWQILVDRQNLLTLNDFVELQEIKSECGLAEEIVYLFSFCIRNRDVESSLPEIGTVENVHLLVDERAAEQLESVSSLDR